jgi:hypothetical protein
VRGICIACRFLVFDELGLGGDAQSMLPRLAWPRPNKLSPPRRYWYQWSNRGGRLVVGEGSEGVTPLSRRRDARGAGAFPAILKPALAALVLADVGAPAILTRALLALVLADVGAPAILTPSIAAIVLADVGAAAILTRDLLAVALAEPGAAAILTCALGARSPPIFSFVLLPIFLCGANSRRKM